MRYRPFLISFIILFMLLSLNSCKLREKIVYLQDATSSDSLILKSNNFDNEAYAPTLRPDDLLQIQVGGQDAEALAPFQFYVNGGATSTSQNATQSGIQATQLSTSVYYLVDPNGNINFPVLGFVNVVGLTRLEATLKLQDLLAAYVKDPVVNIQIRNFKITVLGQVQRPGVYMLPSDRVTILEAIGMAGDLQLSAVRNNILVIRESFGKREEYRIDLTKKDVYNSPAYYLRQNDIVYIEPNKGARFQGQNIGVFTQVITPVLSLILSIYTLFVIK